MPVLCPFRMIHHAVKLHVVSHNDTMFRQQWCIAFKEPPVLAFCSIDENQVEGALYVRLPGIGFHKPDRLSAFRNVSSCLPDHVRVPFNGCDVEPLFCHVDSSAGNGCPDFQHGPAVVCLGQGCKFFKALCLHDRNHPHNGFLRDFKTVFHNSKRF